MNGSARSQVAINLGFSLIKSVSVIISIRMADVLLSSQMMGLLLLFRRQGSLWGNLVQLGFSQSLMKFYTASNDAQTRTLLWRNLVRWVALAGAMTMLLTSLFAEQVSRALFGLQDSMLATAFGIYIAGIALGFMAVASWMSEFHFVHYNIIDWLNGSLLFVFCLGLGAGLDETTFAFLLALLTLAVSVAFLGWFSVKAKSGRELLTGDWRLSGEVAQFGLTRAMTAFADMSTLVIGPWLLRDQPEQAGYLIVAYTTLRLGSALVLPVAQVLALRANSHKYDSQTEEQRILWLCAIGFAIACCAVGVYYVAGDFIMQWWLPDSFASVMVLTDELIIFLPGVCLFYALRNHVDLNFMQPFNLYTLVISLAAFSSVILWRTGDLFSIVLTASKYMFSVFYCYALFFLIHLLKRRKIRDYK